MHFPRMTCVSFESRKSLSRYLNFLLFALKEKQTYRHKNTVLVKIIEIRNEMWKNNSFFYYLCILFLNSILIVYLHLALNFFFFNS